VLAEPVEQRRRPLVSITDPTTEAAGLEAFDPSAAGVAAARQPGATAAIKSVTSVPATYLRREADVGAVAPGRYADLLVVDGDPLRDVRTLRNLEAVYLGGVRHNPADLLAMARAGTSWSRSRPRGSPVGRRT
jgi:hypothetical protein